MGSRFYIADDDKVIQGILKKLIKDNRLGQVIGIADKGSTAIDAIIQLKPDIALIDLLMPEIDGIEVVVKLKNLNCQCVFIMISQVDSKKMISRAYSEGIEFYINKPINVVEVVSVIKSVQEKINMAKVIMNFESAIKSIEVLRQEQTTLRIDADDNRTKIKKVFAQIGVLGEAGCHDIMEIVLWFNEKGLIDKGTQPLNKLSQAYDYLKIKYKKEQGIEINTGALEQRIRRTIRNALKNLANLGIEDYYNDIFIRYSTSLFDFSEVRREMDLEREKSRYGGKINVKKFIEGLVLSLVDKV